MDLSQDVGPLPLGAWLVIGGGALGFGWLMRRSRPTPQVSGPLPLGTPLGPVVLPDDAPRAPIASTPGTAPASGPSTTWLQWITEATRAAVEEGAAVDLLTAQRALQDYMRGRPLSSSAESIVSAALALVGPPPSLPDLAPPIVGDDPAPPPPPPSTSPPAPSAPSPVVRTPTPAVPTPATPTPARSARDETIVQAYRDLLGRDPDAGGLAYWSGSGLSTTEIRRRIAASSEAARLAGGAR